MSGESVNCFTQTGDYLPSCSRNSSRLRRGPFADQGEADSHAEMNAKALAQCAMRAWAAAVLAPLPRVSMPFSLFVAGGMLVTSVRWITGLPGMGCGAVTQITTALRKPA